jgi:two-component system, LuxR family, sensor kinase FixL
MSASLLSTSDLRPGQHAGVAVRAARRASASADWPALVIQTMQQSVLVVDWPRQCTLWSSPSFDAQFPQLAKSASFEETLGAFEGLQTALENVLQSRQPVHCDIAFCLNGSPQTFDAHIRCGEHGCLIIALSSAPERVQAEQRRLEDREKLLFTSRVISVGEMATTLAHELNQPIGAIANLLRGIRARMQNRPGNEDSGELLQAIGTATEQALFASRIIARIRQYTQSHQPRRDLVDLQKLAQSTLALLDWELKRGGVVAVLDIESAQNQPCSCLGDEVMLEQVLVNLIRNAIEAMRTCQPAQRRLSLTVRRRGGELELDVSDRGCGVSEQAEKDLFVPFVSTKPTGMGIGLSICRSFMELHQGRLWFTRNDAGGATFHIALPAHDASTGDAGG